MRTFAIFILLFHVSNKSVVYASENPIKQTLPAPSNVQTQYYAFSKSYGGGGLLKTNPTSFTENYYYQGLLSPFAQYRFFMHDEWVVGVSAGFKSLLSRKTADLSMFSVSQEFSRLFRIYHPSWLGIGFKSMYLVGVEKISLPYERDPDQPPQIGVGANLTFFFLANRDTLFQIEVSRWRGTLKNDLHVLELSSGLNFAIQ